MANRVNNDWLSDTASTLDGWTGEARLSHLQGRAVTLELQSSKGRLRGQFVLIESLELIERQISHVERTRRPSTARLPSPMKKPPFEGGFAIQVRSTVGDLDVGGRGRCGGVGIRRSSHRIRHDPRVELPLDTR